VSLLPDIESSIIRFGDDNVTDAMTFGPRGEATSSPALRSLIARRDPSAIAMTDVPRTHASFHSFGSRPLRRVWWQSAGCSAWCAIRARSSSSGQASTKAAL
jgi:hypothetical protein